MNAYAALARTEWRQAGQDLWLEPACRMVESHIERVDPGTAAHSRRARVISDQIGQEVGLSGRARARLGLAAIAHDYGKILLTDRTFLAKEGALTPNERQSVRSHPLIGARRLALTPCLRPISRWIAEHHERWDGKGYPNGIRGEAISVPGRILALAEVFDALASRRPYKEPWPLERIFEHFERQAGAAFDPALVPLFIRRIEALGSAWLAGLQVRSERRCPTG